MVVVNRDSSHPEGTLHGIRLLGKDAFLRYRLYLKTRPGKVGLVAPEGLVPITSVTASITAGVIFPAKKM
ncbi:hypothetical protein JCM15093_3016 [Bacteroides graminisolvens DSM 19988 = JCM 15093]|uniref:Uncharacterized protein n=1 Tax=Bacteroides graminisolvens DSM 19988 = JCM 15093 TaxID=1121097 RepID=A0A069D4C9_9BACE|nr:hypothetical protein JCM15093_3016 [Bacteroides graminisolvens DSM 19988 = JCM 15093]